MAEDKETEVIKQSAMSGLPRAREDSCCKGSASREALRDSKDCKRNGSIDVRL